MSLSNPFALETGRNCFLCWNHTSNNVLDGVAVKSEHDAKYEIDLSQQNSYSLTYICHYLNLKPDQILEIFLCPETEKTNSPLSGFSVTLCDKCGEVVKHLSGLCQDLELLQMKIHDRLRSFNTILENQKMENQNEIVASLKNLIKSKCDVKLKSALPRLELVNSHSVPIYETGTSNDHCNSSDSSLFEASEVVIKTETFDTCVIEEEAVSAQDDTQDKPNWTDTHEQCNWCGKTIKKTYIFRHKRDSCKRPTPNQPIINQPTSTLLKDPLALDDDQNVQQKSNQRTPKRITIPAKPMIICNQCGKMVQKRNIYRHKKVSCKFGPKLTWEFYNTKSACDICGQVYNHRASMLRHKARAHPEPESLISLSDTNLTFLPESTEPLE